jgi:uncharacterized SAM-binding protein YcdF (DUF218 family)
MLPMRFLRRFGRSVWIGLTLWFLIIHLTPLDSWYASRLSGKWTDSDGDILIVLASDSMGSDIIGQDTYWRMFHAVLAWREGHFKTIVVSGGRWPGTPRAEAYLMADFLAAQGVPRDHIMIEPNSLSTRENAVMTAAMLAGMPGRKVLLDSDYHMFRARRAFEAAGLPVIPRPFTDVGKQAADRTNREHCFMLLLVETAKIAGYWWKGWIHLN